MIFLAFLCPLALYLIVLGAINRRRHPLIVSGTWDVIGLLLAASGFLLCTGPGLLSSREEGWRKLWLLGDLEGATPLAGQELWVYLTYLYFVVVVGGSALLFWRQRRITSIYNVVPGQLQQALDHVCKKLGLNPVRSGNLLLFGLSLGTSPATAGSKSELTSLSYPPAPSHPFPTPALETLAPPQAGSVAQELTSRSAILEIDSFPFMSHASLRWDPPDSPVRQEVDVALAQELARRESPPRDLGGWMILLGLLVLGLSLFLGFVLILIHLNQLFRR